MSTGFLSTALMGLVFLVVISQPRLYERNLVTALLLACALVLQEAQSIAVVRSLVLALLQGEACHRALTNLDIASSNVLWVTVFALLQDNLVGVARLVTALALVSYSANAIWTRTLSEAILQRTRRDYWSVGDEEEPVPVHHPTAAAPRRLRRDWGTILQLMATRRAYDMLSRRSRNSRELVEAKRQFLLAPLSDIEARDCFTMAVFSAMSKQGTITVIRTAESSQVRRFASQAAAFVERRFTQNALGRFERVFRPLPSFIDPSEQSGLQTTFLLLGALAGHKKGFQYIKWNMYNGKTPLYVFLLKQTSRAFLVVYLLARFVMGYLQRPLGGGGSSGVNLSALSSPSVHPVAPSPQVQVPLLRLEPPSPFPPQQLQQQHHSEDGNEIVLVEGYDVQQDSIIQGQVE